MAFKGKQSPWKPSGQMPALRCSAPAAARGCSALTKLRRDPQPTPVTRNRSKANSLAQYSSSAAGTWDPAYRCLPKGGAGRSRTSSALQGTGAAAWFMQGSQGTKRTSPSYQSSRTSIGHQRAGSHLQRCSRGRAYGSSPRARRRPPGNTNILQLLPSYFPWPGRGAPRQFPLPSTPSPQHSYA